MGACPTSGRVIPAPTQRTDTRAQPWAGRRPLRCGRRFPRRGGACPSRRPARTSDMRATTRVAPTAWTHVSHKFRIPNSEFRIHLPPVTAATAATAFPPSQAVASRHGPSRAPAPTQRMALPPLKGVLGVPSAHTGRRGLAWQSVSHVSVGGGVLDAPHPSSLGQGVRIATPALRRWFAMTGLRPMRSAPADPRFPRRGDLRSPASLRACPTSGPGHGLGAGPYAVTLPPPPGEVSAACNARR